MEQYFTVFRFIPKYGVAKGVWYSVFHAISAFCNAGIDLLGDNSFMAYKGDVLINITTMFLIVVGGIGFISMVGYFEKHKEY